MSVAAIASVAASPALAGLDPAVVSVAQPQATGSSFTQMMLDGIGGVDRKLVEADRIASAFVLDDSIPVHQVTYAIEEARLSLELMLQVRDRLVDGYQRVMDMQI